MEKQFNDLISLEKFLVLAGLERRDIEVRECPSVCCIFVEIFVHCMCVRACVCVCVCVCVSMVVYIACIPVYTILNFHKMIMELLCYVVAQIECIEYQFFVTAPILLHV